MSEINKSAVIAILLVVVSQITLFILKLTNVIDWDWGWILAPLWVPYACFIVLGIFLAIFLLICNVKERNFKKHE